MCLVAYERGNSNIKYANPKTPLWAIVNVTNECNMSCEFCFNKHNHAPVMALSDYRAMLIKLQTIGIKQVTLCGGEPTTHPDFEQLLIEAKAAKFKIHLLTNGLEMDKILAADAKDLLNQIQFNWNVDTYKHLSESIRKIQNSRVAVTISGTEANVAHLAELVQAANDIGVDKIRIWELCGAGKTDTSLSIQEFDATIQPLIPDVYGFKQSYDPDVQGDLYIPCMTASGAAMFINTNGDITRCCAELTSPLIANILTEPSFDVLQKYREFVATLPKKCFAR
mgnify:FL=1